MSPSIQKCSLLITGQDFFEPGVPPELDLSLDRSSTGSMDRVEVSLTADDRFFINTTNNRIQTNLS